jgi:AraC family transcriptional regulator, regulatory protein of adaptative response / methylated-DNA-[protein]-cysteine methyltransferase
MKRNSARDAREIRWGTGRSQLGWVLVASSGRGVCAILLGDTREQVEREARARFPESRRTPANAETAAAVAAAIRIVERPSEAFGRELDPRGTPFQRRVWQALREVPPGSTTTYSELAARIGAPRSARAVGTACGANPVAVAIPCHRARRGDGSLAGYRWGLGRKRELLRREEAAAAEPERAA